MPFSAKSTARWLLAISLGLVAADCGSAGEFRPKAQMIAAGDRQEGPRDAGTMVWRPVSKTPQKRLETANSGGQSVQRASHEYIVSESSAPNSVVVEPGASSWETVMPWDSAPLACEGLACDGVGCDSGCDSIGFDGPSHPRQNIISLNVDYLLWSLDPIDLPALVTTSPTGTAPENTGVLGKPGTSVLFGGHGIGDDMRSGARITFSLLDRQCGDGFEIGALGVFQDADTFHDNRALLARPVFDTGTSSEASMLIAHPDFLDGDVSVSVDHSLFLIDALHRQRLYSTRRGQLDFMVGYRHGEMDESLHIAQSGTFTAAHGQIAAGTTQSIFDDFQVENRFHGAEIAFRMRRQFSQTTRLHALAKLALGSNQATARINGQTTNIVPSGDGATFDGGLLAQSTNIGTHKQADFSVIPQFGINLTGRLDRYVELTLGYSVVVWTNVMRVGDAVDRRVSQFPPEPSSGTMDPSFNFQSSTFVAHGLNFGAVATF